MLIRAVLEFVFVLLAARAFWQLVGGIVAGLSGPAAPRDEARPTSSSVSMVRDPVCGTFVVPDRAIVMANGRQRLYFCSTACRDTYRARLAEGRTA